ncbi:MAG: c-type cytochrome [Pseudomonadota bacterium]|nr:c-type cytochrome [Pseudomonadota bacterium]
MKKRFRNATFAAAVAAAFLGASGAATAQNAKAAERSKIAMCIGCHNIPGYQASFPEVYKVPKIAGQNAKYIVAALTEYRKGERRHPSMDAIAASLTDQDMADLAAYYEQLGKGPAAPADPGPPPADIAKLLAQANCASCHGKNFSTPIDPSYPKLAGQHADYLYAALKAYQTDHNPRVGRSNAIMMGMARPFTHAEIKALAAYFSSLPGEVKTVQLDEFR